MVFNPHPVASEGGWPETEAHGTGVADGEDSPAGPLRDVAWQVQWQSLLSLQHMRTVRHDFQMGALLDLLDLLHCKM